MFVNMFKYKQIGSLCAANLKKTLFEIELIEFCFFLN